MRRKRFLTVMLMVLLLSIFVYVSFSSASTDKGFTIYTVESGDTLWDIAVRFAPRSMDLRDYVYRTRQMNGRQNTATIHPGQQLKLPIVR